MYREFNRVSVCTTKGIQIFSRNSKVKICYRNMSEDRLYLEIKKILSIYWSQNIIDVFAEDIAFELRVKLGKVYKVLMRFNREGILSQAQKRAAHDTHRNWFFMEM